MKKNNMLIWDDDSTPELQSIFCVFAVYFLIFKFRFVFFFFFLILRPSLFVLLPCSINRLESHPLTVHNIVVVGGGDVR